MCPFTDLAAQNSQLWTRSQLYHGELAQLPVHIGGRGLPNYKT